MAIRWLYLGEHWKAIRVLERLIEVAPHDGRALYQLASVKRAAGDVEGAREASRQAAEVAIATGDYELQSLMENAPEN